MSDTETKTRVPALRGGGTVMAIIPQDIDQVWRLAGMAWQGGMAPKSLVDKKTPEEAQAACAIAIMAGAELGLTPLMSLRSYAVVNGRPSLWGDGIKAVVRQSGRCEYIKTGSDQTMGWCEAKRADTGEVKRVEFTIAQAKAAKLTDKEGPWKAGYADVMMERRASNRCLNDLFADVLGGMASAEEALEDGPIVDVTPDRPTPPSPPSPPSPPPAPSIKEPAPTPPAAQTTSGGEPGDKAASAGDFNDDDSGVSQAVDLDAFLTRAGEEIAYLDDEDSVIAKWEELRVEATIIDNTEEGPQREALLDKAAGIRSHRIASVTGTGDLLGGGNG